MKQFTKLFIFIFITGYFLTVISVVAAELIDLSKFKDGTLGKHLIYFQEHNGQKLSIEQAISYFKEKESIQGTSHSISLGIATEPVWLKISVNNPNREKVAYRLSVETPWLDYIDTWLVKNNQVKAKYSGGDGVSYDKRPMPYRYYAFENNYELGKTDVYIRIETLGPMAIPVRFSTIPAAIQRDISAGYQYGILYGVMFALALYNLLLFFMISQKEYGLYSLYLLGFIANSLSYTGQIHTVFTSDYGVYFQDWLDAFLMITYSIAGLHFARFLLNTASYAPKLNKVTYWVTIIIPLCMLVCALFNQLVFTLLLAFLLNSTFAVLFIAMGFVALKAHIPSASLFLFSSVTAAICIGISTMAVAGVVPYNDFTFKAIELGMVFEAITLALILGQRFRMAQRDKLIAENYARIDPLTNLYNRRGFLEIVDNFWQGFIRNNREFSIILLDIDHFKQINDRLGHAAGDLVLKKISQCISDTIRGCDIAARWGGEEVIILLPETAQESALIQAERLRSAIAELTISYKDEVLQVTSSFGVIGTNQAPKIKLPDELTLDSFINKADEAMYIAKNKGRNQICAC
jgi:diguanylate cyclase (GGDEF)-like protein